MDEFSIFMNDNPYDVITISETWLDCAIEDTILAIDGYDLYRFDRNQITPNGSIKGGGLCFDANQNSDVNPFRYRNTSKFKLLGKEMTGEQLLLIPINRLVVILTDLSKIFLRLWRY